MPEREDITARRDRFASAHIQQAAAREPAAQNDGLQTSAQWLRLAQTTNTYSRPISALEQQSHLGCSPALGLAREPPKAIERLLAIAQLKLAHRNRSTCRSSSSAMELHTHTHTSGATGSRGRSNARSRAGSAQRAIISASWFSHLPAPSPAINLDSVQHLLERRCGCARAQQCRSLLSFLNVHRSPNYVPLTLTWPTPLPSLASVGRHPRRKGAAKSGFRRKPSRIRVLHNQENQQEGGRLKYLGFV